MAIPPIISNNPLLSKLLKADEGENTQAVQPTNDGAPQDAVELSPEALQRLEQESGNVPANEAQASEIASQARSQLQETPVALGLNEEPSA